MPHEFRPGSRECADFSVLPDFDDFDEIVVWCSRQVATQGSISLGLDFAGAAFTHDESRHQWDTHEGWHKATRGWHQDQRDTRCDAVEAERVVKYLAALERAERVERRKREQAERAAARRCALGKEVVRILNGVWYAVGLGLARCPAHEEARATSLLVKSDDDVLSVDCDEGCERAAILAALRARGLADNFAQTRRVC